MSCPAECLSTVQREILADLTNDHKSAKVSSAKNISFDINNIIEVQICQSLFFQECSYSEFAKIWTHQSFPLYSMHLSIQAYKLKTVSSTVVSYQIFLFFGKC